MARKSLSLLVMALALGIGPAQAAWQDTHKAFRVGFLAIDGAAYDLRKLEPFRVFLQGVVGMPVELVPAGSYSALIDAQSTDRVQYAIHSATSYVTTVARCSCVDPLGVPAAFNGAKGFYAIILARADSDIRAAADANGKSLAVTAGDSVAGRLVPLKYLARDGIDSTAHFSSVMEAADPGQAIAALQARKVDLAVGWSSMTGNAAGGYDFGVLASLVRAGTLSMDAVRVVWQSPLIPFGPHVVRNDIPDDMKSKLVVALKGMAATAPEVLDAVDRSPIGGGGFAEIKAADYAVIADLIGVMNLERPAPSLAPAIPALPPPLPGGVSVTPGDQPAVP